MALHESVLEEFGLAPLWVRRGMAAASESPAEASAQAGQGVNRDEVRSAARELPSVAAEREASRPAMRDGDASLANAAAAPDERSAPDRADQMASAAQTRASDVSRSAMSGEQTDQPARFAKDPQQARTAPAVEARQPTPLSRPQPQSRPPEQAASNTPPDDDFAWFDDLPANAPANARDEAPAAPAIHTLDWDALSSRVAACESCRLCEKRTSTVFGVGDRNADWMLIGEAPGENEDRQGEPFVGQAGKLLDNMLRSLTLARDTNVYIANVIKCRPPGNRNPEADEVARCEPYLQRQVGLVKPKLIVALGRFAAQSLLKTDASISSLRGRVHEYEGVPVIVTYHPAYLLRSLPDKAKAWADLCLARETWRAAEGASSSEAK